ncbi:MAG TPA: hypothetical protein VMU34_08810 [Mycobacterium sp.]|nr:hypothetical protein [Mycobacterium sp.]
MSRIINYVAAAAVATGLCSAALTLSPAATADPATPATPGLPGLNMVQQLASDPGTAITSLLQSAAGVLGGASPSPATQPGAVASINLPQLPQPAPPPPAATASITLPQAPSATPATAPTGRLPLPGPLSLPSNLGSLLPGGLQLPGLTKPPAPAPVESPLAGLLPAAAPAPAPAPAQNPLTGLLPFSALP